MSWHYTNFGVDLEIDDSPESPRVLYMAPSTPNGATGLIPIIHGENFWGKIYCDYKTDNSFQVTLGFWLKVKDNVEWSYIKTWVTPTGGNWKHLEVNTKNGWLGYYDTLGGLDNDRRIDAIKMMWYGWHDLHLGWPGDEYKISENDDVAVYTNKNSALSSINAGYRRL